MHSLSAHRINVDPLERLIQRLSVDRAGTLAALLIATLAHAALAWQLPQTRVIGAVSKPIAQTTVVDIDVPAALPPPVVEEHPSEAAPVAREHASKPVANAAPAQAQAAAVLTRASEPNEPVDLTDSIVVGEAATYAGGTTSSQGTSKVAVSGANKTQVEARGHSPHTQAAGAAGAEDQSRRAKMLGGTAWTCPFPTEADADGIDHATVTVRVTVDARGTPSNAAVVRAIGRGFGREAQRCALAQHFEPALDPNGLPRAGTVTINVHFDR